ncbi:hypothetical protein OG552_07485 [Streptomyces sp. NBC_01476]|uniref:hypothetical protein n=1 Tax=Streptomyces sp. NBC_01476 TaxID=2903881 RepID=UPI002E3174EF|nr:hypothetical protein [Streptomyces sp. NBC_01476]
MTTQSPHLCARRGGPAAPGPEKAARVQTRLPWWAIALPAAAFATLLALLSAGPADASALPAGDTLTHLATALGALLQHLL